MTPDLKTMWDGILATVGEGAALAKHAYEGIPAEEGAPGKGRDEAVQPICRTE